MNRRLVARAPTPGYPVLRWALGLGLLLDTAAVGCALHAESAAEPAAAPAEVHPEPDALDPGVDSVESVPIRAFGRVEIGSLVSSVEAAGIDLPFIEHISQIQTCYEQRLKGEPELAGEIGVRGTISGARATGFERVSDTTGDSELVGCLVSRIERWRFPVDIQPGTEVGVRYLLSPVAPAAAHASNRGPVQDLLTEAEQLEQREALLREFDGLTHLFDRALGASISVPPATGTYGPVIIGTMDTTGGGSAGPRAVVLRHLDQLEACLQQRARSNPELSGRIEYLWNVDEGRVSDVVVMSDTTGDRELLGCVAEKLAAWSFPIDLEPDTEVFCSFHFHSELLPEADEQHQE